MLSGAADGTVANEARTERPGDADCIEGYEVIWHGGIKPQTGFTKGELLGQYESPVTHLPNPILVDIYQAWRTDPWLRFLGRFGPRKLKFGTELYGERRSNAA